jgi:hypothetical protein
MKRLELIDLAVSSGPGSVLFVLCIYIQSIEDFLLFWFLTFLVVVARQWYYETIENIEM